MYIEEDVERRESENVQIKNSRIEENGEEIMKKTSQKLHVQRNFQRRDNINSLC